MNIDNLRQAIAANRLRITDHADEEMAADGLTLDAVLQVTTSGEIIEDYPSDHPLPSCLVLGFTQAGDPIHSVWAYNETTGRAVLVTVYRPDPDRWSNWRVRKDQS
jgi:hypothetical protein